MQKDFLLREIQHWLKCPKSEKGRAKARPGLACGAWTNVLLLIPGGKLRWNCWQSAPRTGNWHTAHGIHWLGEHKSSWGVIKDLAVTCPRSLFPEKGAPLTPPLATSSQPHGGLLYMKNQHYPHWCFASQSTTRGRIWLIGVTEGGKSQFWNLE